MAERETEDRRNHNGHNELFRNFEELTRKLLKVPKEEVDEKRREEKREKRAG